MRTLWPHWTLLPAAPVVLWSSYCLFVRREARWELVVLMILAPAFAYASRRSKQLFLAWLPMMLVGVLYDAMRFVQSWGVSASSVHVCDLRGLEARLFGAGQGASSSTLQDWLQAHPSRLADAYFAIPYGIYIFAFIGYAIYLGFADRPAAERIGWSFLLLNVAGFFTYHLYPAAPPWYFHKYGCAVDLSAAASAGPNLERVDAMLGFGFFHGLYGRSHDIFGAVPSLHVTYPVLMLLVGWSRHRWPVRVAMIVYAASMIAGAIYLDHHWIVDVLIGLAYVLAIHPLTVALLARRDALAAGARSPVTPRAARAEGTLQGFSRPSM